MSEIYVLFSQMNECTFCLPFVNSVPVPFLNEFRTIQATRECFIKHLVITLLRDCLYATVISDLTQVCSASHGILNF